MAARLLWGDIIVFHEYFDFVIRSKCTEFLNSHNQGPLIINCAFFNKLYSSQICWYGIIRNRLPAFTVIFAWLQIPTYWSGGWQEMYILYIPKYTLPAEIMVYIVMVRRFLFAKNQRGVTRRFWKTLIRQCVSFLFTTYCLQLLFLRPSPL